MVRRVLRLPPAAGVGFLAFVGIAASATHCLYEPYDPGFLTYQNLVALHVILGSVYLTLAPFQFVKRIRSRHLGYHRRAGRLLVSVGLVVGITVVFIGLVRPFSGWIERVYICLFGALFILALIKGFIHIRAKQVALHREWMIRAFAIGLSIVTQHLIFISALLVVADPTQGQLRRLFAAAFLVAFVAHASITESWIRFTRKRRVPRRSGAGQRMMPTAKVGR
jgi:hypothetical protein